MYLHRSNRAERMLEALCEVVAAGDRDPFAGECIVVQSPGIARYVAMGLSQRLGVWAHPLFPFPRGVLSQLCDLVLGPVTPSLGAAGVADADVAAAGDHRAAQRDRREYDGGPAAATTPALPAVAGAAQLTWAVAQELLVCEDEPAFAAIAGYLQGDVAAERLLQLSQRIAQLFDDYTVYRPDWVRQWGREPAADDWQALLFRRVQTRLAQPLAMCRTQELVQALRRGVDPGSLPFRRLSIFGLSTMPPLYMQAFSALSRHIPVHLFLLSPSQEYWADLTPEREINRRLRKPVAAGLSAEELHFDQGHALLSSLGALGREYLALIYETEEPSDGDFEHYEDPGCDTMLHALQADILHLRQRGEGEEAPVLSLVAADRSIEVHDCHSPMRELQVLHDQLLWLFEREGIRPEQVVVMAPTIEDYAPLITAVFSEHSGRHPIPFRIADRGIVAVDPVIDSLSAVLTLLSGRFTLSELLDVLGRDVVREAFQITEVDMPLLRDWATDSGIRWGIDEQHRGEVGQPEFVHNTVRFGLERLLLGLAMESQGVRTFAERLPVDGLERGDGEVLGRFAAYCDALADLHGGFKPKFTVRDFAGFVTAAMKRIISSHESSAESRATVHGVLESLVADAAAAGFETEVSTIALNRLLFARLGEQGSPRGFMAGGVTFCQLMPMRSVPFSVVVLLGMDDEGFPRVQRPLSFDRRVAQPRPGDRRLRDDDRYLFLEAILSARHKLLISYVGRSVHDNSERPPSVLVVELLSALKRTFDNDAKQVEQRVFVRHALSAYSPTYFRHIPGPYASFAGFLCAGTQRLLEERHSRPFMREPLGVQLDEHDRLALSLSQAERYVRHPIRTFMQERLGLYLGREIEPVEGREPLVPNALQRYSLGDQLLNWMCEQHDRGDIERATWSMGALPLGTPGKLLFEEVAASAAALSDLVTQHSPPPQRLPIESFDIELDGIALRGTLEQLWPDQQVAAQYNKVGRRSDLGSWVRHVVANYLAGPLGRSHLPTRSLLIGRSEAGEPTCVWFAPLADPEAALRSLLHFIREASTFPLPVEDGPSRKFVSSVRAQSAGNKKADPRADAEKAYGAQFGPLDDPYVRTVYPSFESFANALDGAFARLSQQLYAPLLDARSEERGQDDGEKQGAMP